MECYSCINCNCSFCVLLLVDIGENQKCSLFEDAGNTSIFEMV